MRYDHDVQIIKRAILSSQYQAGKAANAHQLALYYAVGGYVSANTRKGTWGTGAIDAISEQLQKELPGLRGFSARNLKYMRTFYEEWSQAPVSDAAVEIAESSEEGALAIRQLQLPNYPDACADAFRSIGFTHHCTILSKVKDRDGRLFYLNECASNHLSVEELKRAIARDDWHRQGQLPNNFLQTLRPEERALRAVSTFKDEYLLDYINVEELGVRDELDVDERVLEQGIVHNIKNFIMEFGRDFAFVGNQYHLDAFGEDQYVDLLFFNRGLNCLVAVELKAGPFRTSYLGQLSGYLSVLDGFVRKPHENSSIGIVLCKDMNKAFVNYVVRDYDKPMSVATYRTSKDMPDELLRALPPIEGLEQLLQEGEAM